MSTSMNKALAAAVIAGVIAGTTALADEATNANPEESGQKMSGSKNGCSAKKNSCNGKAAHKKKKSKNNCNSKNGCNEKKKEAQEPRAQ